MLPSAEGSCWAAGLASGMLASDGSAVPEEHVVASSLPGCEVLP